MDKISIVVAVYNTEIALEKCISSLLEQTYKNTEIILVEDCSTDNSLKICREFEKKYGNIKVICNEKNLGVSATRNSGIKNATGVYICFVDSDDYVEPNYLQQLYTAMVDNNALLSICGNWFHDYTNNTEQKMLWDSEGNIQSVSIARAFELSDKYYLNALWNKLFVTDLIKKQNIIFDESLSMGEDLKFSLDYIEKNHIETIAVLSLPLYHYIRWNNNSLMAQFGDQAFGDYLANAKRIYQIIKPLNKDAEKLYNERSEKIKSSLKYVIIRSNKTNKQKLEAIKHIYPSYNYSDYLLDNIIRVKEKIARLIRK